MNLLELISQAVAARLTPLVDRIAQAAAGQKRRPLAQAFERPSRANLRRKDLIRVHGRRQGIMTWKQIQRAEAANHRNAMAARD